MFKLSLFFILLTNLFSFSPLPKNAKVEVSAWSYVVVEKQTHQILEGKNEYIAKSVASISKLMTAYVALKHGNLDDQYLVGEEIKEAYGSCVYLNQQETISLRELLFALMLRSGNDAALVIAKNIGGSVESFVEMMNIESQNLHLPNSLFRNPHGLDEYDGGNECSAYAIAILQCKLLEYDEYFTIVNTQKYDSTGHGVWFNKNRLLRMYEYTTGGKTGYTVKAKRTLVTSASKDNLDLIIVTINCGNDFNTHKLLYDKYFDSHEARILALSGEMKIDKYTIFLNQDLKYFMVKEEWNNYRILYVIDEKKMNIRVSLVSEGDTIFLNDYKIISINDKVEELNFFQKIVRFFKRIFNI